MGHLSTILLYHVILLLCVLLSYKGGRLGVLLSFIILICLSGLRYDIGNDYEVQLKQWDYIASLFSSKNRSLLVFYLGEPIQLLFCYFFQSMKHPGVYLFFCYSLIFYFFLFKAINYKLGNFTSAIFIFITSVFIFYTWDWTRQGVSFAIFLYSIRHIENRNFLKYFAVILLASLFHFSSWFLLPFYYICRLNIGRKLSISLVFLFTVIALTGFFKMFSSFLINKVGGLVYENYIGSAHSIQMKDVSIILVVFKAMMSIVILYFIPVKEKIMRNLITIGTLLYLISSNNLLVERISYFFLFVQILACGYIFLSNTSQNKIIRTGFIVAMLMFFNYTLIFKGGTRGSVPYDNVLLDNFNKGFFRYRKFLDK